MPRLCAAFSFAAFLRENVSCFRIPNQLYDKNACKKNNENFKRGQVELISARKSKVKIYVIPTDEELLIARDTKAIVTK